MRAVHPLGAGKDPTRERLRAVLDELVPHLALQPDGCIMVSTSAATVIDQLYELAGRRLVRLDGSPAMEAQA